tara:strand:- start:1614 stop:2624 length:1011 start_codon:yes stop_codon:yes gene_type:complete
MINFLIVPIVISFLIVLFVLPFWIVKTKEINLTWRDMNKYAEKYVSGSGGLIVCLGFLLGVFSFVAYRTFYLGTPDYFPEILATLCVILILCLIGIVDDLFGWVKGGLSKKSRLVLTILAAIPLVAINAGKSQMSFPFFGTLDFGIFYPLVLIPLGIVGAATTFNFLAGFNGEEAGQGILLLAALGFVAFFTGNSWLTMISFCMVAALSGFLIFNFSPAKIFPGDSLTYSVGGLVAIISILGDFEKIALFFFIPFILETGLKLRGNLSKYSFGKPLKNGKLKNKYSKFYSLNHIAIFLLNKTKYKATEKKVVYVIWIFQFLIILTGFIIFREGIFV